MPPRRVPRALLIDLPVLLVATAAFAAPFDGLTGEWKFSGKKIHETCGGFRETAPTIHLDVEVSGSVGVYAPASTLEGTAAAVPGGFTIAWSDRQTKNLIKVGSAKRVRNPIQPEYHATLIQQRGACDGTFAGTLKMVVE